MYQLYYSVVSESLNHIPAINGNIVTALGLGAIRGRLRVEDELRSRAAEFKTIAEVEQSDAISHATTALQLTCAHMCAYDGSPHVALPQLDRQARPARS